MEVFFFPAGDFPQVPVHFADEQRYSLDDVEDDKAKLLYPNDVSEKSAITFDDLPSRSDRFRSLKDVTVEVPIHKRH